MEKIYPKPIFFTAFRIRVLRRIILLNLVILGCQFLEPEQAIGEPSKIDQEIRINWKIHSDQADIVRESLHLNEGKSLKRTRGVPLIPLIVGTTMFAHLAETIIKIVKDIKHGGLVVKMIDGELEIREMAQLDQGTVLVIGDKKTETFFNSPEANLDVASLIQAVK
ncbi:MAG: hypothetical protein HOJ79_10725 [Nitrospina sp.]|jgi:hypothetical protein|nr:hypothetical protein [Nitrospina sp.]